MNLASEPGPKPVDIDVVADAYLRHVMDADPYVRIARGEPVDSFPAYSEGEAQARAAFSRDLLATLPPPNCTAPQVLLNCLGHGMSPNQAEDARRMLPLDGSYVPGIESRVSDGLVDGLARRGILLNAPPPLDYHMGTYQMAWRDGGLFRGYTGARRAGKAAGAN